MITYSHLNKKDQGEYRQKEWASSGFEPEACHISSYC